MRRKTTILATVTICDFFPTTRRQEPGGKNQTAKRQTPVAPRPAPCARHIKLPRRRAQPPRFEIANRDRCKYILIVTLIMAAALFPSRGVHANPNAKTYLPDEYERDDAPVNATPFNLHARSPQVHNFHKENDQDWLEFHALKSDNAIEIKTFDPGENCETVITLFDRDGTTMLRESMHSTSDGVNLLSWRPLEDGIYYVRVARKDSSLYGDNTSYSLWIYRPIMPVAGFIDGIVTDAATGAPLGGAVVSTAATSGVSSHTSQGYYFLQCPAGEFTVAAGKSGYESFSTVVTVGEDSMVELNIPLTPSYDYNSTYDLAQWGVRDGDAYYCLDICYLDGNAAPGLRGVECGESLHAWSAKTFINITLGIPDSYVSGLQFMWKVWSRSGYGGEGFEGVITVP